MIKRYISRSWTFLYFALITVLLSSAQQHNVKISYLLTRASPGQSLVRINEFSYKVTYRVVVRRTASSTGILDSRRLLDPQTRHPHVTSNGAPEVSAQPPPLTFPICVSKSDYEKAFGTLAFPQADQLPAYSWDGGPGCPEKKTKKNTGGNTPGPTGGGAADPLAVAIDHVWTTEGAKLLPAPVASFDPPTAITGVRVYLRSRSLPSVSVDLAFHGAELTIHATSDLWVEWAPNEPLIGPFPTTSSGWPAGLIHHTYTEPGRRLVVVSERWHVTWSFDGHAGELPTVVRTAVLPLRVQTLRRILLAPG